MWKIGNVEIKNRIVLAPMAGITDLPFRILCKENGAGHRWTEHVLEHCRQRDECQFRSFRGTEPIGKNGRKDNHTRQR